MAFFLESLCPVLTKFEKENVSALSNQAGCVPSRYFTSEKGSGAISAKMKTDTDTPNHKVKEAAGRILSGMQIVLVLSSEESKLKMSLRKRILENNGQLSFIVTNVTNFVICGEKEVSLVKLKSARKYNCPIVTHKYIDDCLAQTTLLPTDGYLYDLKKKLDAFQEGRISCSDILVPLENKKPSLPVELTPVSGSTLEGYELVKYAFLKGATKYSSVKGCSYYQFATVEIHVRKTKDVPDMFCVFVHEGKILDKTSLQPHGETLGHFVNIAKDAVSIYCNIYRKMIGPPKFLRVVNRPQHPNVGSPALQNLFKMIIFSDEDFDPKLMSLVNMAWNEARIFLSQYLTKPDLYPEWKVREARTILIQIMAALSEGKRSLASRLSKEFYATLAFKSEWSNPIETLEDLLQRIQVCNLLMITSALMEASSSRPNHVLYIMYTSLKCQVFHLHEESTEYKEIRNQILNSQTVDVGLVIHNVYSLRRNLESANFTDELKNQKLLYHGTLPSNVISVLANGLVRRLAVMTTEQKQKDLRECSLGYGIYFADSVNACLKYCNPSSRGTMFVFVSRVALGEIYETCDPDPTLTVPPTGFNSVLGVKNRDGQPSFFQQNEYVIYQEKQQEIRYLVEFSLESLGISLPVTDITKDIFASEMCSEVADEPYEYQIQNVEDLPEYTPDVCSLKRVNVPPHSTDSECYLESTHVRARIVDLVAKITVFQVYKNNSEISSEVRYSFPLCGGAAICGFEAFIGSKHVIGEVKEKETAHKEYTQAVSEGHGAYLLDEEKPDLFTARLGNLPANVRAIIKITYIVELSVLSDTLKLTLPGSISPCQNDKLELAGAHTEELLSFEACIEMATNIQDVFSTTHPLQVKKTDTKAVIRLRKGCNCGTGLEISIRMCEVHIPRMWTEKHPEKGTEVCMVSYYPEFESDSNLPKKEVILLLDASNSMRGEYFQTTLTIAMLCLKNFDRNVKFNIVAFGSLIMELFPESQDFNEKTKSEAQEFLRNLLPDMGGNNLSSSLLSCNFSSKISKTNVFLITDGWFDNENHLYSSISKLDNIRLFTLAVSEKANHHFMKRAARCSGGSYEEYLQRDKNTWERKVKDQILKSGQFSLSDIKVEWQVFDSDSNQIIQAPQKIKNLFSGSFLVVYGFVCNCTVATLKAKINNREFETVVSAHKLSQIKGTLLHTLAAKACIDDWEEGLLDDADVLQTTKKESSKENIIAVAKEYNLVSSLTSFIAVEKRQEGEVMIEEPSIKQLLDQCNVDILSYISFEGDDFPGDSETFNTLKSFLGPVSRTKFRCGIPERKMSGLREEEQPNARKQFSPPKPTKKLSQAMKKKIRKAMFDDVQERCDQVIPKKEIIIQDFLCPGSAPGIALPPPSKPMPDTELRLEGIHALQDEDLLDYEYEAVPDITEISARAKPMMTLSGAMKKKKKKVLIDDVQDQFDGIPEQRIFFQTSLLPGSATGGAIPPASKPPLDTLVSLEGIPAIQNEHLRLTLDYEQVADLGGTEEDEFFGCGVYFSEVECLAKERISLKSEKRARRARQLNNRVCAYSLAVPDITEQVDLFHARTQNFREMSARAKPMMTLSGAMKNPTKRCKSGNGCISDKLKLGVAGLKGISKYTLMNRQNNLFFVPFAQALYDEESNSRYGNADTLTVFHQVLTKLGGGVPLCNIILKVLRSEYQTQYDVDIVQTVSKLLEDDDCCNETISEEIGDELNDPSTHVKLKHLEEQVLLFIRKMEESGLKSLGTSITNNICQLARLLFAVFYYIFERCFPVVLEEGFNLMEFADSNDVLKFVTKCMENFEWEMVDEIHVLGVYLVWIHLINEKYPLLYSTLDLGTNWECAVLEYIRKVL